MRDLQYRDQAEVELAYPRPCGSIESAIIDNLAAFADARQGRYNNFDALDNEQSTSQFEPLRKWWDEVAEPILTAHYYDTPAEQRVRTKADVNAMIGGNAMVLHFYERGQIINTVAGASIHSGKTEIVQKFG